MSPEPRFYSDMGLDCMADAKPKLSRLGEVCYGSKSGLSLPHYSMTALPPHADINGTRTRSLDLFATANTPLTSTEGVIAAYRDL
jgi:hypothetical protein